MRGALSLMPALATHQRRDFWAEGRTIVLATVALAVVIFAYLFGIPLVADRLAGYVPAAWETRIGDVAAVQIERSLTAGKGYVVCDSDPQSPANQAIARFVSSAFDGLGSPFTPHVTVVRSNIPNAFALPGGRT